MSALFERLRDALADRYRVERELGRGGMAAVFLARDLRHDREVAIKVLDPELAAQVGPARFLREIALVSRLRHPNIVPLYDSGDANGSLFYVMPFVAGETLRQRLMREPQLPVALAIRFACEIADALESAHRAGVVHRDVKPENILIEDGHALLADFGIAGMLEAAGKSGLTGTGVAVGTPAYMSPEQASGEPVGPRSDLYALGCVTYEMLAGQPPFTGPSADSVIRQHLATPAPLLRTLRPAVPDPLARAIARALSKTAADRPTSAAEFCRMIGEPEAAAGRRRPGRALATVLAIALLLGIALAVGRWGPFGGSRGAAGSHAIAVMPFTDLTGPGVQDYFADGLTDELIGTIAQVASLRVISRASVMPFKGGTVPVRDIARRLGVDVLLEGTVRRDGPRVHITAELIGAHPERLLWSRSYDRELRDVLALQSDLAQSVTREVQARLTPDETARISRSRPVDPIAHEAYLRGRYLLSRLDEKSYRKAIEQFGEAVRLDPASAPAWTGLAETYYFISNVYMSPAEAMPRAREAAQKALAIDSGLGDAHASLGVVIAQYDRDWLHAERELRTATRLSPSNADAHFYLGTMLSETGRMDEACVEYEQARALDPLSDYIATVWNQPEYFARRYDEVAARCERVLAAEPDYAPAHALLGLCRVGQSRPAEAEAEFRRAVALSDNPSFALAELGHLLGRSGRRAEAAGILDSVITMTRHLQVTAYCLALLNDGLGNRDETFRLLERGVENRDEDVAALAVDPAFEDLRKDARFSALLRRMNLGS